MALLRSPGETTDLRRSHWLGWLRAVAFGAMSIWTASTHAAPAAGEYEVKAAYLLNFARFVEWPDSCLPPGAPLQIAIVGDDPFGGALDEVLRRKSANGHPIQLRRLRWNEDVSPCQIVFISASVEEHLPYILASLGNRNVLTVSDIDRFALRGGVIELRMVGNRVRFDINRTAALAAGLTISSKLFSVARAVREGGPQ